MTAVESQYNDRVHPEAADVVQSGAFETSDFDRGQLLRYTPSVHRLDESTGEPVIPLVYFQGINGDESLPAVMEALGERDQRPVMGLRYSGALPGTSKPILAKHPDYSENAVIPEIDTLQADDAIAALEALGITKVDALATSRGGLRWLLAMKKRPELFRNAYGDDVAGQDGRGYGEAHRDAVRLVLSRKMGQLAGKGTFQSVTDTTQKASWPKRRMRDLRTEQKSVARAQLGAVLAEVAAGTDIHIRLGSGRQDKAFRTENVRRTMRQTGADQHVMLVETDKGSHGIGTNSQAIDVSLRQLREMERSEKPTISGSA